MKQRLVNWLKLCLGLVIIFTFILLIAPPLLSSKIKTNIEQQDIDASALFYTESPEAGAAEFEMKKR